MLSGRDDPDRHCFMPGFDLKSLAHWPLQVGGSGNTALSCHGLIDVPAVLLLKGRLLNCYHYFEALAVLKIRASRLSFHCRSCKLKGISHCKASTSILGCDFGLEPSDGLMWSQGELVSFAQPPPPDVRIEWWS